MTRAFVPNDRPLRVAINAQLLPSRGAGGIESVLIGLVSALGRLDDGPEEYVIICPWQEPDWLRPYSGSNQRMVSGPQPRLRAGRLRPLKRALSPLASLGRAIRRELVPPDRWQPVPVSDGFYENLGTDVIHFPFQIFTLCGLPTIYNPHDLQHLHYPQFFNPSTIAWRETIYPAGCHFAHTVVAGSQWIKEDIVRQYHIDPDKIQVIPYAPPTQAYPSPTADFLEIVRDKYQLQYPFMLYPAVTWAHKNHLRLLEAIALLRHQQGLIVRLVCTGEREPSFWPQIEERLHRLNLDDQVQFLGRIPPQDLRAVYRLSQFVIVPTLFEATSGPVFEAWEEGVPVACSTVTALPEQAGDAALLFDPFSVEAIADSVRCMATDVHLRDDLMGKGRLRLRDFSWERTAKAYRAVYRRAAHYPLSEEDRLLLGWDWMRHPTMGDRNASC